MSCWITSHRGSATDPERHHHHQPAWVETFIVFRPRARQGRITRLLTFRTDVRRVFHDAGDGSELVVHARDLIDVTALPSNEESNTRLRLLPTVVPKPRSNGLNEEPGRICPSIHQRLFHTSRQL